MAAPIAVTLQPENRIGTMVMTPYVDRLADFGLWFRQLWAESLGKRGNGTTPIRALGTVDQHSQLQLYLDGPRDKMFTVIMLGTRGAGGRVEAALADDDRLAYLRGRTMGDLMEAGVPAERAMEVMREALVRTTDEEGLLDVTPALRRMVRDGALATDAAGRMLRAMRDGVSLRQIRDAAPGRLDTSVRPVPQGSDPTRDRPPV